jgi:hypothetical protein
MQQYPYNPLLPPSRLETFFLDDMLSKELLLLPPPLELETLGSGFDELAAGSRRTGSRRLGRQLGRAAAGNRRARLWRRHAVEVASRKGPNFSDVPTIFASQTISTQDGETPRANATRAS